MDAVWPLIGRQELLTRCGDLLGSPSCHGIALTGDVGDGKTRLLAECVQRAEAAGLAVVQATAHRSSARIPFGALAPLLPPGERMIDSGVPMFSQAAEALTAHGGGRGQPLVLAVDNAHLLDEPSAVLVYQLVATRRIVAMLAVCSTEAMPDAVTAMWRDERVHRLELDPLTREEVGELVHAVLGSTVAAATIDQLHEASCGNPLVLRELVRGSLETGRLVERHGLWRAQGGLAPSARLRELVEARLASLTEAQQRTLELVAIAEPIGLSEAEFLGGVEIEKLEAMGLLVASQSGFRTDLTLAHPSIGEVLRADLPLLRGRNLRREIAAAIGRRGARRRGDIVRMASLHYEADRTGPPDILAAAARQAYFAHDLVLAEQLARAAEEAEPRFETHHLLKDVLYRLGRGNESHLAHPSPATEAQRALLAMSRAATEYWQLGHRTEADSVLEAEVADMQPSPWRDELIAMRANLDVNAGEPLLALSRIDALQTCTGRPYVVASLVATLSLPHVGRAREALDIIEPARAAHLALDDQLTMFQVDLLTSTETTSLIELGRLREATLVAMTGYRRAEQNHDTSSQAFIAFSLGRAYLARGMVVSALRWSREAVVLFTEIGHTGPMRWAIGDVALAAALHGDKDEARRSLALLDELGPHAAEGLNSGIQRARAWLAVAEGDPVVARTLLDREAERCRERGLIALEALLLHDLARLDAAKRVVDRLGRLAAGAQGNWLQALADDAAAIAGKRGDELAASADSLDRLGANLIAAESAMRAAGAYMAAGNQRESTACRRRAGELLRACEGARTPAVTQAEGPVPLTDREREIALLAAAGLSSKAISERLFLSARTVDNNLSRVFTKLGISDRSAIGRALQID